MSLKRNDSSDNQLSSLMEIAGELVLRLNTRGEILHVSKRTDALIGHGSPLAGMKLFELVRLSDRRAIEAALRQAIASREVTRVSVQMATRAVLRWYELQMIAYNDEEDVAVLVVGHDISGQQATEERLRHMATHDELTGLPNRSLLSDRLRMAIAQSRRTDRGFAVVALDLDGFKKVNDALGHPVGDALLRVAAARLRETLRDVDTLARVGGDEFVAVLHGAVDEVEIHLSLIHI